jgi:cytochrome oxidase Cu insertion factor (SCO1/SenC/PrrC family)
MPPRLSLERHWRDIALALMLVALAGVGVGTALALSRSSGAASSPPRLRAQVEWPAGSRHASPFRLVDQRGRVVSPATVRGSQVLLTFLDSRCRSMCPLEGRELAAVARGLTPAERPVLLVVSVDPWGDTPQSERAFAARAHWHLRWHWLNGSERALRAVWRTYAIAVKPTRADVSHSAALYLIDRDGFERAGYLAPLHAADIVSDLRALAST